MGRPELRQVPSLGLGQVLALNPVIQQSLEMLQMSSTELEELIEQELNENPLLEVQQDDSTRDQSPDDPASGDEPGEASAEGAPDEQAAEGGEAQGPSDDEDPEPRRDDEREDHLEFLADFEDGSQDYRGGPSEEPWRPEYVGRTTLAEHLLSQARDLRPGPDLEEAVRYVVYSLDRHGLVSMGAENLAADWPGSPELLDRAVDLVRSLEPTGVGCFTVREALLAQLDQRGTPVDSLEYRLIDEYFDLLPEGQYPVLAKALRVTPRDIQEAMERVRGLNPFPGSDFSPDNNTVVIPDISVIRVEGEYIALLNDTRFPSLVISERNRRVLESPNSDPQAREYVREKYTRANRFLRAIQQRQDTVLRIGQFLASYQSEYFDDGVDALKPLTLQQVADALGRNQSTISRAINGKYLDSPQGINELAFFFSRRLAGAEDVSTRAAKEELRRIVEEEDQSRPYSDCVLSAMLRARGLAVKRRTVANYRKLLGIPPASHRKRF